MGFVMRGFAVESDSVAKCSLFMKVINLLNIDYVTIITREIQPGALKLGLQHQQVEALEIKSGQVAVADELRYITRYRLETRFAGDIRVCNAVDLRGFPGNSDSGPDPFPESVNPAVRHDLQNPDLYNLVGVD